MRLQLKAENRKSALHSYSENTMNQFIFQRCVVVFPPLSFLFYIRASFNDDVQSMCEMLCCSLENSGI